MIEKQLLYYLFIKWTVAFADAVMQLQPVEHFYVSVTNW